MRVLLRTVLALSIIISLVLTGLPALAAGQIHQAGSRTAVRAPGDPVTVGLTSSPVGHAVSGQPVTFTASVSSPEDVITGTVDFLAGATIIAQDVPLVDKSAVFTTDDLPVGEHTITAVYSGDENNDGSQSEPLLFTVDSPAPANRIVITIDHTKIDQNLTHFPVLIHLSRSSGLNHADVTEIFDELGNNFKKIIVTAQDDRTQLYVDVEVWDSSHEEAWLWVSRSGWTISGAHDTTLYLYYDAGLPDNNEFVGQSGSAPARQVWDSSFLAVYHMTDGADSGHIYDSTGNRNDGQKVGGSGGPQEAAGSAGRSQLFNGVDDYIDIGAECAGVTGDLTLEAFFNSTLSGPPAKALISGRYGSDHTLPYELALATSNTPYLRLGGGTGDFTIEAWRPNPLNEWSYVFGLVSGSTMYCGMNTDSPGSLEFSGTRQTGPTITLGMSGAGTYKPFSGRIDEIRLSTTARSPAWIYATNYTLKDQLLSLGEPVPEYTLTIAVSGEGTVSPGMGSYTFTAGTEVRLTAAPAAGWYFQSWEGDYHGVSSTATIVMDKNKNVVAHFTAGLYKLTVLRTGKGEVTVNPVQSHYSPGDVVELVATPEKNWTFSRWTDVDEEDENTAVVVMNSDRTVRATFVSNSPPSPPPVFGGGWMPPPQTVVYLIGFDAVGTLVLDSTGALTGGVQLRTGDGQGSLVIPPGTRLRETGGDNLKLISAVPISTLPAPSEDLALIKGYVLGPDGAIFDPALTLTINYADIALPVGGNEADMYLAYYDGRQWVPLDSRVDTESRTVSAQISHFSQYALLMEVTPLSPPSFSVESLIVNPSEITVGNPVEVLAVVKNSGDMAGSFAVVLKINGQAEDSRIISLEARQTREVPFQVNKSEPGEYRASIEGVECRFVVLVPESSAGAGHPRTEPPAATNVPVPEVANQATQAPGTDPVSEQRDNSQPSGTILAAIAVLILLILGILTAMVMTIRRRR
jgi:hypothetical protein